MTFQRALGHITGLKTKLTRRLLRPSIRENGDKGKEKESEPFSITMDAGWKDILKKISKKGSAPSPINSEILILNSSNMINLALKNPITKTPSNCPNSKRPSTTMNRPKIPTLK